MSPISHKPAVSFHDRSPSLLFLLPVLMLAGLLLAGCGGGGDSDKVTVLATVGEVEITSDYYEGRLAKLEKGELPKAADGTLLDTGAIEGKMEFLNTLVSKEIMVLTGHELGFDKDPNVVMARNSLTAYEADLVMWNRVIETPSNSISNEELDTFYASLGKSRKCRYIITNFLEDAQSAREFALTGADWEDVVEKFHDGVASPSGSNDISVPFGRYKVNFENEVFRTEIGGVTEPIYTVYGYWVMKVDEEKPGKKPPLEQAKAQILDVTRNRKLSNLKEEFRQSVRQQYEFTMDEESLWLAYKGLPHEEEMFLPGTQDQVPQESLDDLKIESEDLDRLFYSYLDPKEGRRDFTLGDFKALFDEMSVFARPKKNQMLGGLRGKIEGDVDKVLMTFKAEDLGLYEDPEVVDKVDIRIEEMVVHKLYTDLVHIDETVTDQDMDAFWAEHSHEFIRTEVRYGHFLVAMDEGSATKALAALDDGGSWRDVLLEYGTDKENKERAGLLDGVSFNEGEPISTALFSLEPGSRSMPFAMDKGRYGIVELDRIEEARAVELNEVREIVGQRIRNTRKEDAFNEALDKWRAKFPVVIHEDKLDDLASWEELTAVEVPENLVPRN